MTRDEAIAEIQWHLGNRSDLFDQIVLALKRAQRQLELGKTLPWFLKNNDTGFDVDLLDEGYADLPTGFLREDERESIKYWGGTNAPTFLEKVEYRVGIDTFRNVDAGNPRAYCILKDQFLFFPAPRADYVLDITYYKASADLSTNISNNEWLVNAPEALIGKAGGIVAATIANTIAKPVFDEMFLIAWAGVIAENEERYRENYSLSMGARL